MSNPTETLISLIKMNGDISFIPKESLLKCLAQMESEALFILGKKSGYLFYIPSGQLMVCSATNLPREIVSVKKDERGITVSTNRIKDYRIEGATAFDVQKMKFIAVKERKKVFQYSIDGEVVKEEGLLFEHNSHITSIKGNGDMNIIACHDVTGKVTIWRDGKFVTTLIVSYTASVPSMLFIKDYLMVYSSTENMVSLFSKSREYVRVWKCHTSTRPIISHSGNSILLANRILSITTKDREHTLPISCNCPIAFDDKVVYFIENRTLKQLSLETQHITSVIGLPEDTYSFLRFIKDAPLREHALCNKIHEFLEKSQ